MARAGANAQADSKPEAGQLAADEPLPEWEAELLAPTTTDATAAPAAAEAPAAEAPAPAAEPAAPQQ